MFAVDAGAGVAVPVPHAADVSAGLEAGDPRPISRTVDGVHAAETGADDDHVACRTGPGSPAGEFRSVIRAFNPLLGNRFGRVGIMPQLAQGGEKLVDRIVRQRPPVGWRPPKLGAKADGGVVRAPSRATAVRAAMRHSPSRFPRRST